MGIIMSDKFEVENIEEVNEAVEHFNHFHDDYVAGIEIKFENYKSLDDEGASTAIRNADKTIILTVNTYPYKKEHEQFVIVAFEDVKSFEISSPQDEGPKAGPTWGILDTIIRPAPNGIDIKWKFVFICGDANFSVICAKIVFHEQTS